jgi:hypothetical protein
MEWRRQEEVERLVSALAFDSFNRIHLLKNVRDKFLKRLDIGVLRQVAKRVGEIDAGVTIRYFDEHFAEDDPAKFASFIG